MEIVAGLLFLDIIILVFLPEIIIVGIVVLVYIFGSIDELFAASHRKKMEKRRVADGDSVGQPKPKTGSVTSNCSPKTYSYDPGCDGYWERQQRSDEEEYREK